MPSRVTKDNKEWFSFPSGCDGNFVVGIPLGELKVTVAGPMVIEREAPVYHQVLVASGEYIHTTGKIVQRKGKLDFEPTRSMATRDSEGKSVYEYFMSSFESLPEITFQQLIKKIAG
jgi:hypothetical protein